VTGSKGTSQDFAGDVLGTLSLSGFANISWFEIRSIDGQQAIDNITFQPEVASVPEPATLALAGAAMPGIAASRRRKPASSTA